MSKRYGRNQRRAARTQIADLQQALTMDRALLERQARTIQRLQAEMSNACRIAGQMSILFPAVSRAQRGSPTASFEVPRMERFNPTDPDAMTRALKTQRLDVLLARVDASALRDAIHVRLQFGDGSWGYAVSQDALQAMPTELLERQVIESLARMVAPAIRKAAQ